ncbi:MAG: thiol-disulfide oxidoreductase ResA [Bacteroidetes bacterium]|nr:thiol-disulfide oxidoreductase ResA [Bacteroidota bacterium]
MMKSLFPLSLVLMLCGTLSAQTTTTKTSYAVDENSIVKDSTGRQISKLEFYEAVMSGNYQFKPVKDKKGTIIEFMLVRVAKANNNTTLKILSSTTSAPTTVLRVGDPAPDFSGTDMTDSVTYDLNYFKGRKVVVLNFWFSTCRPCIDEVEDLNRIKERYKDRADIVFIAPTFDYPEIVDSFLTKHPFKYAILPEAYEAVRNYKAIAFPLNVIIDFDGKIAYVSAGGLPGIEYLMDRKIKDLLGITKDDNLQIH